MSIDQSAPVRFIRAAFAPSDSIGVLLKTYRTGQVIQRIVTVTTAIGDRFQAWLRYFNAHGWNVYVGVIRAIVFGMRRMTLPVLPAAAPVNPSYVGSC